MPKRKRQPDDFDVAEFLRESDDDLKSALNSLLRAPETEGATNLAPEPEITPPLKLDLTDSKLTTAAKLNPGPELDGPESAPGINLDIPAKLTAQGNLDSLPISDPPLNLVHSGRRFAIREMRRAADAHTRAEQHVYERLWEIAQPYDELSRTITIGFGAMANLVGLSESNARINLRSLLAKLAVEEIAEYNCERSQGRTYRVFNEAEILRRRREAGLRWYMRRTLAVVFVDPATGQPLLKNKPLRRQDPVLS
jgi:hypothetical protein